VTLVN